MWTLFVFTPLPLSHSEYLSLTGGRRRGKRTEAIMSLHSEIYALATPDVFDFCVDDLLDLSNDDIFSPSTTDTDIIHLPPLHISDPTSTATTPSFDHDFYIPNDDVAELEWLSNFVDESSSCFSHTNFITTTATTTTTNNGLVTSKARTKRPKPTLTQYIRQKDSTDSNSNAHPSSAATSMSKCTHCASEQTPQWRTGPLGPKTLCNACGVRYKSGRLVPEYRPAASPTFVLSRHSNSHRKVMELRRQKEAVGVEYKSLPTS